MAEDELEVQREILHEFRSLVKSPGWVRLVEIAESQIQARENLIITEDFEGLEAAFKHAGYKGERRGIKLFLQLPESIMESAKQTVEELLDEREE